MEEILREYGSGILAAVTGIGFLIFYARLYSEGGVLRKAVLAFLAGIGERDGTDHQTFWTWDRGGGGGTFSGYISFWGRGWKAGAAKDDGGSHKARQYLLYGLQRL